MLIKKIYIDGVRNLKQSQLDFHPEMNVFVGANGSGKTSLLESIFFLALGRSFRTNRFNNIVRFDNDFVVVSAIYSDKAKNKQIKISTSKHKNQEKISKIGGAVSVNSQIAALTPTQIIHDETSKLIFKEPDVRRKFLDWLVFYSNKNYQHLWREFKLALYQRNMLLKKSQLKLMPILNSIDEVFVGLSEKIKIARQNVWESFGRVLVRVFDDLEIGVEIKPEISLFHGWNGDLLEKLIETREIDLKFGVTHRGPHKADLKFVVNGKAAKEVLSRGQGKVLSLAMILARSLFIRTAAERECFTSVLLIDDLCSELDDVNVGKIIQKLFCLRDDLQIFITGTDKNKLLKVLPADRCSWFEICDGAIVCSDS